MTTAKTCVLISVINNVHIKYKHTRLVEYSVNAGPSFFSDFNSCNEQVTAL